MISRDVVIGTLISTLLLLVFVLCGCGGGVQRSEGQVVAEAGGEELTLSGVPREVFIYGGGDSLGILRAYAQRWAEREVVYQHAMRGASRSKAEIDSKVEDYRRTLTIVDFEHRLVESHLDTAVSEAEILAFYNANPAHFTLQEPLVRCLAMSVPQGNAQLPKLRKVYSLRGDDFQEKVEPLAFRAGVTISSYPGSWVSLHSLERALGVKVETGTLGHRPQRLDFTLDSVVYLVFFHEWRESGSVAPIDYVFGDVRAILINQRRNRLIDSVTHSIVQEARSRGALKVLVQ